MTILAASFSLTTFPFFRSSGKGEKTSVVHQQFLHGYMHHRCGTKGQVFWGYNPLLARRLRAEMC